MISTNHWLSRNSFTRRSFVRSASVAGLGLTSGTRASASTARMQDAGTPLRYAVIGDSHIMPTDESRAFNTSRIFAWLESLQPAPDFVIHIGDLTEAGFQVEYEQYGTLIPDSLRDRIHHVPGNREVQWDEYGKRTFIEWYGQAPYSFDARGVHFVALDATILLQPLGQFGGDQVEWLRADLETAGPDVPTVLFFHYPVGGAYYFVTDQDALYDVIAPYNVVAIHAGHVHRETVSYVNGFVQATMRAVKDGAFLHLVDQIGETLEVTTLEVLDTGEAVGELVATIPMQKNPRFKVSDIEAFTEPVEISGVVQVAVPASLAPMAIDVAVRTWPDRLSFSRGGDKLEWVPLAPDIPGAPTVWSGAISLKSMSPGRDRIEMSASDSEGWLSQHAFPVTIGLNSAPVVAWEHQVSPFAVHADLKLLPGGEMLATTVGGDVVAYAVSVDGASEQWRLAGEGLRSGIIGAPIVTSDGTVVVGRVSGFLDALQADGSTKWQVPFDRPVLASLGLINVGAGEVLTASTGGTVHALNVADGALLWENGSSMFTGGRTAADGGSVYASFADGTLRAFALGGGEEQWQVTTYSSPDIYSLVAKSGWGHATSFVQSQNGAVARVVTGTERSATGHDVVTGVAVWEVPGPYMYAAPLVLDSGMLVMGATDGTVSCADPISGTLAWQTQLDFGVFNAAPLQHGEFVLVPGAGAQLAVLHASTGDIVYRLQLGGTALFGTPVIAGDLLVAGGEDGMIRAVPLSVL